MINLGVEIGAASHLSLADRIQKINEIVGAPVINGAITPYREKSAVDLSAISPVKILAKRLNADDISYRHDRTLLAKAIDELVGELELRIKKPHVKVRSFFCLFFPENSHIRETFFF